MPKKADSPKDKRQAKKGSNWINWFVPLLLVLIAIAVLLFSPAPEPKKNQNQIPVKTNSTSQTSDFIASDIANSLVSTFFNGSEEDQTAQTNALEKTLVHLNNDTSEKSKTALSDLISSNINNAVEILISLANEQDDQRESAKTWVNIGNIQNLTSTEQALLDYQKASELDQNNSNAWNRLGHIHRQLKQFDLAEAAFKKVQSVADQSTTNKAFSLVNFGLLNQSKDDFKAAEDAFIEASKIYKEANNEAGLASTSEHLATLYKSWNVFSKAEHHYLIALKTHEKLNNFQGMSASHSALGSLYKAMKQTKKSQTHYEQALQISLDNNFEANFDSLYNNLGTLAQQNGDLEKSEEYFKKSSSKNTNAPVTSVNAAAKYGKLAILNRTKNNFPAAEEYHKKAIAIYQANNHGNGVISQKINLGFLYKVWGKIEQACDSWQESLFLLKSNKSNRVDRIETLLQNNCR